MKRILVAVALVSFASPAWAQFGGLGKVLDKAQKVEDRKKQLDDLNVTEEEEQQIGQQVSAKIRERFGVVQDAEVTRYVALAGTLVAQQSERPKLPWTFIVLDTDGVNAFASPGGYVHITRGALGLIHNEAELAAVLAHEIGHVAHKHTVNAIRKNRAVQLGTSETLSNRGMFLDKLVNKAYEMVLENSFDRGDELDADKVSVDLTQKVGYAPASLADFLARLDERNKDQPAKNGLFASHPETKERIEKVRQLAGGRSGATVEARYRENIKYQPTAITKVAVITEGSAGLAASGSAKDDKDAKDAKDNDKKDDPQQKKKGGFGLGALKQTAAPERQSAQVSASGGARGVGPDRAAKGGDNPKIVKVTVSAADLEKFRKGIAG